MKTYYNILYMKTLWTSSVHNSILCLQILIYAEFYSERIKYESFASQYIEDTPWW